jgi:hypothetical protein
VFGDETALLAVFTALLQANVAPAVDEVARSPTEVLTQFSEVSKPALMLGAGVF